LLKINGKVVLYTDVKYRYDIKSLEIETKDRETFKVDANKRMENIFSLKEYSDSLLNLAYDL
jgi:hypothetical protein